MWIPELALRCPRIFTTHTPATSRASWTFWIATFAVLQCLACGKGSAPRPDGAKAENAAASSARAESAAAPGAKEVTLAPVTEVVIEQTIDISGTLDADEQVTVGAKVPGRLASIAVDLASPVTRDQVIAQLETRDYELRIEQAAAALAQSRAQLGLPQDGPDTELEVEETAIVRQASATLKEAQANQVRARNLAKEGLMSGMDLDAAEAAAVRAESGLQSAREEVRIRQATVRQRRSELRMARQQLADAVVRSPIDGVVQLRRASVGQYLAAGAPIADIVRIDPLRLRVAIPELEAAGVRQGQAVRVTLPGDRATYPGTVARLAPAIDPQSRTLLVESDIKNPGHLRPGSLVTAQIVVDAKPAPTVPASAIVRFAGLSKVVTVENGKAKEKPVTTGRAAGDRVEIVSGLTVGESVVAQPGSLQQGQPVLVKEGS
ncbi:RND transporter [Sorangium cellulosum]|uniref:RND transporter n=1 Tax=Sorangium cellulosum TaxID=56 RepID=A0A2L0ERC6_SORCE|nr:efflux RND transporter periplasmic adaptor subunit [Sorangium cellulosum]AUX41812.1 RND transporter [Sorangium cellulosum]